MVLTTNILKYILILRYDNFYLDSHYTYYKRITEIDMCGREIV